MSEHLAKAAEKMGMPEALVMRSAEAKAKAGGTTVDAILAEWAGESDGAPAAAAPAAPAAAEPAAPAPAPAPAPVAAAPAPAGEPGETITIYKAGPIKDPDAAPLLVGRTDSPWAMILAIVAVVAVGVVLAAIAPGASARNEVNASVGNQPEYSASALEGRNVYLAEGCASCHTQMVRSVVTDADLGPVTQALNVAPLSPDTLGHRRLGPDLAHAGVRERTSVLTDVIDFLEDPAQVSLDISHQRYGYLGERDLANLAQFIVESK
jgi:cytochrome c oxidase cbb3-type subunit 2